METDTPTMSRSGRVVKKSIKLLEMDESAKAKTPSRLSITPKIIPKTMPIATSLISPNSSLNVKEGQTNLKVRLSFSSGDFKIQPKGKVEEESIGKSTISFGSGNGAITLNSPNHTTTVPVVHLIKPEIIPNTEPSKVSSTIILENGTTQNESSTNQSVTSPVAKKAKIEIQPIKSESIVVVTQSSLIQASSTTTTTITTTTTATATTTTTAVASVAATTTMTTPKLTILQVPKSAQALQLPVPSTSNVIASPAVMMMHSSPSVSSSATATPTIIAPRTITMVSTRMPTTNPTSFVKIGSNIVTQQLTPTAPNITRSIQEQRRINQANRAKLATTLVHPQASSSLTPRFGTPAPSYTMGTSSSSSSSSTSKRKSQGQTGEKKDKRPSVSAYVLWCKDSRRVMRRTYPELDFASLSKKMGEIWHQLPQNEKATWFSKAKMIAVHGPSIVNDPTNEFNSIYKLDHLDESMIPKVISDRLTFPVSSETANLYQENFPNEDTATAVYENEQHKIGLEFSDLEAYFNILGDSLMSIGSYLKRGVRYNSDIDYRPEAALSTLLDTAMVAFASLTALSSKIPILSAEEEKVKRMMDSVILFMPPNDLN